MFPGKPDGTIDSKEIAVLERITAWMQVNGEAIYATRPWKIYGEGPNSVKSGSFQGNSISKLGEQGHPLHAQQSQHRCLRHRARVARRADGYPSLGTAAATRPGAVTRVELLGTEAMPQWQQTAEDLRVDLQKIDPPADFAAALRVHIAA